MKLTASFSPSPPVGFTPPGVWGDESFIRTRLGDAVTDLAFEAGAMYSAALSPGHFVAALEQTVAPARAIVKTGGAALLRFRAEALALSAEYFANNQTRQDYLMTRAIKR